MARFKQIDTSSQFVAIDLQAQLARVSILYHSRLLGFLWQYKQPLTAPDPDDFYRTHISLINHTKWLVYYFPDMFLLKFWHNPSEVRVVR